VPVGAGRLGSGGAYFHMWHSHNEREIINNGIFPGGMMTFVVIEPQNVPID
jgi:manganese oxidase